MKIWGSCQSRVHLEFIFFEALCFICLVSSEFQCVINNGETIIDIKTTKVKDEGSQMTLTGGRKIPLSGYKAEFKALHNKVIKRISI